MIVRNGHWRRERLRGAAEAVDGLQRALRDDDPVAWHGWAEALAAHGRAVLRDAESYSYLPTHVGGARPSLRT